MTDRRQIPVIGILGGIGSGKSTVAAEFGAQGCVVIDADRLAHQVLQSEEIRPRLAELFGPGVFEPDGNVSRKRVGEIVFSDASKLAALNSIIHPAVMDEVCRRIDQAKVEGTARAVVLDIPLLMEVGWHKRCDRLVFVRCQRHNRLERLKNRSNMQEDQLDEREKFHISLDNKASAAYYIIDNDFGPEAIKGQVGFILSDITSGE